MMTTSIFGLWQSLVVYWILHLWCIWKQLYGREDKNITQSATMIRIRRQDKYNSSWWRPCKDAIPAGSGSLQNQQGPEQRQSSCPMATPWATTFHLSASSDSCLPWTMIGQSLCPNSRRRGRIGHICCSYSYSRVLTQRCLEHFSNWSSNTFSSS